jgi:uncharacterized DUF497 family protein
LVEFEWDANKAALNVSKHGVSFAEAMTIFGDPLEAMIPDPVHAGAEMRFVSIGVSEAGSHAGRRLYRTGPANSNYQRAGAYSWREETV